MEKGITKLSVAGFKSIANEIELDIKPLTLLAGANSSGKSSFMQPLLLMKQTMECDYDPGVFLLDGPNVNFTSIDQFLSSFPAKNNGQIQIGVYGDKSDCTTTFQKDFSLKKLLVERASFRGEYGLGKLMKERITLFTTMSEQEMAAIAKKYIMETVWRSAAGVISDGTENVSTRLHGARLWLHLFASNSLNSLSSRVGIFYSVQGMIHVPGLRGNPARSYRTSATGPNFPGTFEKYVASIIALWADKTTDKLSQLRDDLSRLGLTSKISAKRLNDAQIEVMVGRLPQNGRSKADMVSIADVGFGVSQTLPVLVALLVAEPGQLVYLEQPEIHLHPRAQRALAEILVAAANRGVKVVAETHSSMLLLAVQTLIAKGKISPDNVALHWFQRNETGMTEVTTAELDEAGRFGEWPVDFGDVELEAEGDYLEAVALTRKGR